MNKRKMYLLQATEEQNQEQRNNFQSEEWCELVGESTKADEALKFLAENDVDGLILGLTLSGYDGIRFIKEVRKRGILTKIIVVSALNSDEVVKMAIDAGADYYMVKPCNLEQLKERVLDILEREEKTKLSPLGVKNRRLDEKLGTIFINVGIPPHIKGYGYLREGVKLAVRRPEIVNNITKQLYPMIGKQFKTTPSKVERAIRHAIEVAWNRGRIDNINNILGVKAFVGKEKPTNGEFIALIADKIMLEEDA